jgi:hypothetical protein
MRYGCMLVLLIQANFGRRKGATPLFGGDKPEAKWRLRKENGDQNE